MRQVRWVAEASRKGMNDWRAREDFVYAGWFDTNDRDEEPHAAVLRDFDNAKETHNYLDWRLVREIRSFERKVIA